MSDEAGVQRALALTGLEFPRGILGEEAASLVDALDEPGGEEDIERLVGAVAAAHWPDLRASVEAGLRRGRALAGPDDLAAFEEALAMATRADAEHPLARALAADAALSLRRARERARGHLVAAEEQVGEGGPPAAVAASKAAGAAAVELLDLTPEDYEPEIVSYVAADGSGDALDALARGTGDGEVRAWARSALRGLDAAGAPAATDAVHHLAAGPPPPDAAHDLVWVPAVLALVQEGIEQAATDEDV